MGEARTPRVTVIGAPGQLGTDVVTALRDWAPVALGRGDLDVTDVPEVERVLESLRPDVVVNCAAFHRVDECEHRPDEAFRVNALGALHVARVCARLGALPVYISTDYVFDGAAGRPYVESDHPRPLNVYGASKLAGEHLVAASTPRHLIVRVASVIGVAGARGKGGNFVETMVARARAGEPIRVVNDITMSPTYAGDAANVIRWLVAEGHIGTVHAASEGMCSWYELAAATFSLLNLQADLRPQRADEIAGARRPPCSALRPARLAGWGWQQPTWQEALRRYLVAKGHLAGTRHGYLTA